MLRTEVNGDVAGTEFGSNVQTNSAFGLFAALGVELGLGPGALLAEFQFGYGDVDTYVLRDTNVGALSLMVGYRFMFPRGSRAADAQDESDADYEPAAVADTAPPDSAAESSAAAVPAAEAVETSAAMAQPEAAAAQGAAPPAPAAGATEEQAGNAQVRGHIRSFSGEALRATIRVQPGDRKASTNDEGYFELDVPPGHYTVRLRAFGYASQTRRVQVDPNGVTVLNVELRKK
jgi:hypothetical protein